MALTGNKMSILGMSDISGGDRIKSSGSATNRGCHDDKFDSTGDPREMMVEDSVL
jgi:hypothetical protein